MGKISTPDGCNIEIYDCIKVAGSRSAHIGKVISGQVKVNDIVSVSVDVNNRIAASANHTATHLLQKALRIILGSHVEQAGSLVSSERLRFDFTHFAPLSEEEIEKVENIVNEKIFEALPVTINEMPIDEARKKGAMALFGEKYGDYVRVVEIGDYSIELCGGTHLTNTHQVRLFKIISESGISAGVRRIEAITGEAAFTYYKEQDKKIKSISKILKTTPDNIISKIESTMSNIKELSIEIDKMKRAAAGNAAEDILKSAAEISKFKVIVKNAGSMDMNSLRQMGDQIRDKFDGIIVLISDMDEKVNIVATAGKEAVSGGAHCGEIVKAAAAVCGGGGGGKPNSAQAGSKDKSKIDEALKKALEVIKLQLNA
ncbi:alanyl-trna synthetase [Holotrichia oblita]|nr:alanyl-trna synthetase [Holotrichia oblita]